jgi:ATP-dependent DNA ligase
VIPAYRYVMKPTRVYPGSYVDQVLVDPLWIVELKYDGSRTCVYVDDQTGDVQLWNRHGVRIPEARIPDIYEAVRELALPSGTILDGEVYPRGLGTTATPALGKFKYALFDVMGSQEPLELRQARLRRLIRRVPDPVHYVDQTVKDKAAFVERVMADPVSEGVVMKRLDSLRMDDPRVTHDSPYWLKMMKPRKFAA